MADNKKVVGFKRFSELKGKSRFYTTLKFVILAFILK